MKKAKLILTWIIGIMFILTGITKLINLDKMSMDIFIRAAYPMWLFYLVGITELAAGALLLIKSTRPYGSLLIIGVMTGAIASHIYLKDNLGHIIAPVIIIIIAVLLIRKKEL